MSVTLKWPHVNLIVNSIATPASDAVLANASEIASVPAGGLAASNVQTALDELDTDKLAKAGGTLTGALTITDVNVVLSATTGTKFGTATTQKLSFYNATPIVQPAATDDLGTALSNLGLRAVGTAYPITTSGAVGLSGTVTITDVNIVLGTTTGTKFGTATTQKLSFYNATPVVRPSAYTQTFSTADKTHANRTATALTVTDGAGTNDGTIGAITGDASVIAAAQELAAAVNKIIVDLADTAGVVNAVVDDLQALGLVG